MNKVKFSLYLNIAKNNLLSPPSLEAWFNFLHSTAEHKLKRTKLKSYPSSVVLYINKNCNYSCTFCYNQEVLNNKPLQEELYSIADLKSFLESKYGKKSLRIALMGGEPFLNKNIHELVAECKRHKKIVNIVSNGSLISEDDVIKMKETRLDAIGLSLYDNNTDHIARLAHLFNHYGLNYWVQTVVDASKYELIDEKLDYAVKNKISNFILSNYNAYFDDSFDKAIYAKDAEYQKIKKQLMKKYDGKINVIWPTVLRQRENDNQKKCTLPFSYIHLDKEGIIAPCCYRYPKEKYGNIYSEEGWNSQYNIKLRENMFSDDIAPMDECKNCENLYRNLYF